MMLRASSPLCGSRVEYALDAVFISVEKTDSHLQVVSNSKFVSVGVQSPTEINAPRGCAVILIGICQLL